MYTLRLSRALLAVADVDPDAPVAAPTTRLGDWYVVPFAVGRRSLLACASDRTGLTLVLPRPDLTDLPEALGVALVPVLRALGVPEDAIVLELDQMATGDIAPAADRAVLGRLRAQARRASAWISAAGEGPVDVPGLHARLCATVASGIHATIAERTRAVFRP